MGTHSAERLTDAQIEQARAAGCLAWAEQRSELKREGAAEYAGPCPLCGGEDRFHVTEEWFFCRHCHEKRGDAIELVQWLGLAQSFAEAVAMLTGQGLPAPAPAAPRRKRERQQRPPAWRPAHAAQLVASAQERLFSPAGEPGCQYLLGRGLEPHTWLAYGLGYTEEAAGRGPAIVLPWYRGGQLVAVRYRLLEPVGKQKIVSEVGSRFGGLLYGGQALLGAGQRHRALLLCEGELNALSVWQVARETQLDVLSLGSESARITETMSKVLAEWRQVIVWADRAEVATSAMQLLPGSHGISSPQGRDANDLLQAGLLGGMISAARAKACKSEHELEGLLWDLWDAADRVQGIDSGTASMVHKLAAQLGKSVALFEPEPGRWITKR